MTPQNIDGRARRLRWRRLAPWIGAAAILLTPLVAMRFTDEVQWTGFDFAAMGIMLAIPLAIFEATVRASASLAFRAAVALAMIGAFLLVWINLAVGIIGSEDNPANLMFFGVLAAGIVGAFVADFRAPGLFRAMLAMAVLQTLAGALALFAGWGADGENWPQVIIVLTGFFAILWFASAWLFRKAARTQ